MDNLELIKQPYHVTVSQYNYNIYEERVLLRVIEKLQKSFIYDGSLESFKQLNQKLNQDYQLELPVKDLLRAGTKKYKQVELALDSLMTKLVKMEGVDRKHGKYKICSSLVLGYKYFMGKERVKIKLSKEIISYLCSSLSSYTKFSFQVAFNCSSPYTVRIYKYISHWREKNNNFITILSVQKLRECLLLGDKYKRANSIKQIILDPAIRELKKNADVWFSILSSIKKGRKVVGWNIKIHKREFSQDSNLSTRTIPVALPQLAKAPPSYTGTTELEARMLKEYRLSPWQVTHIFKEVGEKEIRKTLNDISLVKNSKGVHNIGAYTAVAFNKKYALNL